MAIVKRGARYGVVVWEGGRHRWFGTFSTHSEAKEAEAKALLERHALGDRITVAAFAATWLEHYPRPKRSTEVHYRQSLKRFLDDYGSHRLRDLSRPKMRAWAIANPSAMGTARAMLGDAQRDALIAANPLAGMRLPQPRGRRDIEALSEVAVKRLVAVAREVHGGYGERFYAPMIALAAHTGLRPGELHGLRWEDIGEDRLRVVRQYSPKAQAFTTPKNGLSRDVPLIPLAKQALQQIPRTTKEVFLTRQGRHFSGRVSHYYWSPVRAAFGDPRLDFYALRHYFGSMLARNGVNAPEIARVMGHTDGGKLALELYVHISEREAHEKVMQAFAEPAKLRVVDGGGQS